MENRQPAEITKTYSVGMQLIEPGKAGTKKTALPALADK
jgi:hypothetical protein